MKLLVITDLYPDQFNPIGNIFVKHQVMEMQKHYDVYVFATHMPSFDSRLSFVKRTSDEYHYYFRLFKPLYLLNTFKYWMLVIPAIKKTIKQIKPDIIHVHDCRHVPELVNLAPMLHKTGIPHYLTVHNITTHPDRITNPVLRLVYRFMLPRAYQGWNHIFCVNDQLVKQITSYTSNQSISRIGNAINPCTRISDPLMDEVASFIDGAEFKIISAGNLKVTKGFDLLIKAVSELVKDGIDIRLAIFGDGEQRPSLENVIRTSGTQDAIRCFGGVENTLLRNLYPFFDAFILPSYSETFGIVYLEAMSAGIMAVGVRGQGIDGVIKHGENGLLLVPKSISSIISQIRWMMANPGATKSIAKAGKAMVDSDYRMDQLCASIRTKYETR